MQTTDPKPKPKGFRVLVIGESGPGSEHIASLLELQGHDVRVAHDSLDALRLGLEFVPHVAFISMRLATKNQFELPAALRSLHETRHCKLILTAEAVETRDLRELTGAGLTHVLRRPINLESLARVMDEVYARPLLLS